MIESRNSKVVNTNEQYCSIVRTRLGPVSLLLAGEVDCCYDYKPTVETEPLDPEDDYHGMKKPTAALAAENISSHYVELKTSKVIRSDRDRLNFEKFKMLKFWAQSFLLGVPRIIVGFRDDQGILVEEETLETLRLPGLVRAGSQSWDGNVAINFAGEALAFIKSYVTKPVLYRIRYISQSSHLEVEAIHNAECAILSEAYLKHRHNIGRT